MQKKRHTSNRTQRRAAERAALKAARKAARQNHPLAMAATTSGQLASPTASDPNHTTAAGDPTLPPDNLFEETQPSANHGKSTGPRTEAGKQTSSRNAIKHGLCAPNTLILPTESMDDYLTLEAKWFQTYRVDRTQPPLDPLKSELILTAARAEWIFKRSERNYSETEIKLFTETPNMSDWTDEQYAKLNRVLRYRTANANLLRKHRRELESHIKARAAEATFYQNMQHKDAKLAMASQRHEYYCDKHKPFDLEEELELMRQKAIRLGLQPTDPDPVTGEYPPPPTE